MDLDTLVPQGLGKGVVLLPGLLGPHHVIEEQFADVVGGQSGELQSGSVDDGPAELAYL